MKHAFARKLRREQTDVERRLWYALRNRQAGKLKFRRQQPLGPYIVDFVCFEKKLIVELDGSQHALPENVAKDLARTAFLEAQGYRIIRFWNHDVNEDIDCVIEAIYRAAQN